MASEVVTVPGTWHRPSPYNRNIPRRSHRVDSPANTGPPEGSASHHHNPTVMKMLRGRFRILVPVIYLVELARTLQSQSVRHETSEFFRTCSFGSNLNIKVASFGLGVVMLSFRNRRTVGLFDV